MSKSEIWRELKERTTPLYRRVRKITWRTPKDDMLGFLARVEIVLPNADDIVVKQVQLDATLYNVTFHRTHVEPITTTVHPVMRIRMKRVETADEERRKIASALRDITSEYYHTIIVNDGDHPTFDMSATSVYRDRKYRWIQEDTTWTTRVVGNNTVANFNELVVRNAVDPLLYSSGMNSEVWNKEKDKCAVNALLYKLKGRGNMKTMTRLSVYDDMGLDDGDDVQVNHVIDYCQKHNITIYIVGINNKLRCKYLSTNRKSEALFFKVSNDHIYPIESKEMQNQIVHSLTVSVDVPWEKTKLMIPCNVVELMEQINDAESGSVIMIEAFHDMNDIPQSNLNMLAGYIYDKERIVVENTNVDEHGNISAMSYLGYWIIMNNKYTKICSILEKVSELEIAGNKEEYKFRNQSIQGITKQLIESYRGELPTSNLSTAEYYAMSSRLRGAYNETLDEVKGDCTTLDIGKCYTSVVYARRHEWGVFKPWDELVPYSGGIVHGAKYIVSADVNLNGIKLGPGMYDSQFVENLISNGFINYDDITHEIVPSMTIPPEFFKELIDIIYEVIPEHAKDMINLFLGSMGTHIKKNRASEMSSSDEHMKLWLAEGGKSKDIGNMHVLYKESRAVAMKTNMPIHQAIIQGGYWGLYQLQKAIVGPDTVIVKYHSDSITARNPRNCIGQHVVGNRSDIGIVREDTLDVGSYGCGVEHEASELRTIREWKQTIVDSAMGELKSFALFGKPGRGKSYTAGKIAKKMSKYMGASLSHKSVCNMKLNGIDACVLAALFATKPHQTIMGRLIEIRSMYDTLMIDEYTMTNLEYMEMFYILHKMGMKFIFIGDYHQLPPIDKVVFDYRKMQFFKEMCGYNFIELTKNHRFDEALDAVIAKVYNEGILDIDINGDRFMTDAVEDCGEPEWDHDMFDAPREWKRKNNIMDESVGILWKRCKYNVCFTRKARANINESYMSANRADGGWNSHSNYSFVVGSPVICKINKSKEHLFNNSIYEIEEIGAVVKMKNVDNNHIIEVSIETFTGKNRKTWNFEPAHCITTHSLQGSTVRGDMCIYESHRMSRNMLYTALSRATALKHIFIHNYQLLDSIPEVMYNVVGEMPVCIDNRRKPFKAHIYEIHDKNNVPICIDGGYDGVAPSDILGNKGFGIKRIDTVYFDNDANANLTRAINKIVRQYTSNGVKLENNVMKRRLLKQGFYSAAKKTKKNGCVSVGSTCVRFRWSVNGKKKEKKWKTTRNRTIEQAETLAREFMQKHNE